MILEFDWLRTCSDETSYLSRFRKPYLCIIILYVMYVCLNVQGDPILCTPLTLTHTHAKEVYFIPSYGNWLMGKVFFYNNSIYLLYFQKCFDGVCNRLDILSLIDSIFRLQSLFRSDSWKILDLCVFKRIFAPIVWYCIINSSNFQYFYGTDWVELDLNT